jgi:hypothetical protein
MTLNRRPRKRGYRVAAAAACVLCAGHPAGAADSAPFVGFDLGWARYPQNYYTVVPFESSLEVLSNSTLNRDRLGWDVFAGYRFNRYVNLEVSFVDLGSIAGLLTPPRGTVAAQAMRFSVKGETLAGSVVLPLGDWNVILKGGVFFAETDLKIGPGNATHHTQHGLVGLGIERRFGANWGARLAFTDYLSVGEGARINGPNIKLLSTGLTYTF